MFFGIIFVIWILVHIYLVWRTASVPVVARHVPIPVLIAVGTFLGLSYLFTRWLGSLGLSFLSRSMELVGANWIGIAFLLFVGLFIADIATGFGFLWPRMAPAIRGWGLVAGLILASVAVVQGLRPPVVSRYEVQMAGLPAERDGMVVVSVSDLHIGSLQGENWLAARVDQIEAERPDLVVLAGDIVEGHGGEGRSILSAMRRLHAPLGVWAVNGNHETHGVIGPNETILESAGFHVLRDEWVQVQPGLAIAGVDDLTARRRRFGRSAEFVDRALAGRPTGVATIFVSHTPWEAERAAKAGVGLMLSGHTHNGQIWPFNYVVGRMYPLLSGEYRVAGMPVIVCRGTGTWGPKMRPWKRSEIVRITLRSPNRPTSPMDSEQS